MTQISETRKDHLKVPPTTQITRRPSTKLPLNINIVLENYTFSRKFVPLSEKEMLADFVINNWSVDEIRVFEREMYNRYKDFEYISEKIRTKSSKDIIKFYYMWKKTRRRDVLFLDKAWSPNKGCNDWDPSCEQLSHLGIKKDYMCYPGNTVNCFETPSTNSTSKCTWRVCIVCGSRKSKTDAKPIQPQDARVSEDYNKNPPSLPSERTRRPFRTVWYNYHDQLKPIESKNSKDSKGSVEDVDDGDDDEQDSGDDASSINITVVCHYCRVYHLNYGKFHWKNVAKLPQCIYSYSAFE